MHCAARPSPGNRPGRPRPIGGRIWTPTPASRRRSAMATESPVGLLLRDLAEVLEKRGHRWYLFGAQAVTVWGRPRTSADVDVTAEVDLGAVVSLVRDVEAAGFSVRVADPADFASRTRVIPFLHVATQIPLDLVLAGPGLEEEFLARS